MSERLRISIISPPLNMSGGIKVIAIYAKALAERGHRVIVISPAQPAVTTKQRVKALLKGKGWRKQPSRTPSHLDGLGLDSRILPECRPVTDQDVPDGDVVIATWWETAEWVAKLDDSKGAKMYFVQGHEVFPHLPVERVRATYRLPLQKIVIAKWLQDLMREEYGDESAQLVSNAVDHKQFFAPPRTKQSKPTVGFLYSAMPVKGVDVVMAAVRLVRQRFPELQVIAFGIYQPDEYFDTEIEFHYSPPQAELRDLYARCDVWVTASRSEGFNLPAMEAMACRTPVVATRTGWPEQGVVSGKNGVLVDIDDVEGLAEGIAAIISLSETDWRVVSDQAYQTAAAYSWENSIQQFEQVLAHAADAKIGSSFHIPT
ncbi:glycosyltransferase family 4 protein [Methylomonas methanica]|uniref:Glycosyl transferase group 1 n=1 Tax=Methylomonas methanica (strain DSM 25384 / MC09) TaxID=857087 RepID=G0A246_METMM|nr:glycosyltransferase family 4 protein [Methylomonas methanica]AEG02589.1 glycosyl transferase group 1 [Methylomonas methanica MC09]